MSTQESRFTLSAKQEECLKILLGLVPKGIRQTLVHPPYYTGYSHETLYDWDQYFDAILLGYCGYPPEYIRNGIGVFLALQEADGFIPRSFHPGRGVYFKHNTMFKPFLAQTALLTVHQDGETAWLEGGAFQKLLRFYLCWRKRFDLRGAGLAVWHEAEHTGMDNHYDRAGQWNGETDFCEGIDLNCYLVREGEALAILAAMLGREDEEQQIRASLDSLKSAIREWLWNEDEGLFFDYHVRENRGIPIKYVGAFAALWAGVASEAQAARMVEEHLLNEKEFWRPFPVPALAATEPGYSEGYLPGESTGCCNWRANTWIPTNYMTFHGLRRYGYDQIAAQLANKTFDLFSRGRFSEYYTSESGVGTGLKPFWGWSALAIFMPLEAENRTDPTALLPENPSVSGTRKMLLAS